MVDRLRGALRDGVQGGLGVHREVGSHGGRGSEGIRRSLLHRRGQVRGEGRGVVNRGSSEVLGSRQGVGDPPSGGVNHTGNLGGGSRETLGELGEGRVNVVLAEGIHQGGVMRHRGGLWGPRRRG